MTVTEALYKASQSLSVATRSQQEAMETVAGILTYLGNEIDKINNRLTAIESGKNSKPDIKKEEKKERF